MALDLVAESVVEINKDVSLFAGFAGEFVLDFVVVADFKRGFKRFGSSRSEFRWGGCVGWLSCLSFYGRRDDEIESTAVFHAEGWVTDNILI
ncbi:hypothetical protein [Mucilaginibacter corticis]|uniref:hypothetical protein n=1 Tax=Mucilaginibacter corticis TaxID=2597670 RepID=UPI001186B7F3|nr:hypothetical protein [Mucilaginibacter corticis]